MQQGPTLRILFRLSPCVNLFYLFLFYTFLACKMSKEAIGTICKNMACRLNDACYTSNLIQNVFGVLFSHHLRSFPMPDCHMCLETRVHYQGLSSARYMLKSPNTLGSVRSRKFGLICISSESCLWSIVGLPDSCACYPTFRYIG